MNLHLLADALRTLAEAHTQADSRLGYTVEGRPLVDVVGLTSYCEAWGVVRQAIGLPVTPEEQTNGTSNA